MRWSTVALGPQWEMGMLKDVLGEHGIPAMLADVNLKTIDPFSTAPFSLDCQLHVPEGEVERSRSLIDEWKATAAASVADEPPPTVEEQRLAYLSDLGRRIRWATVLGLTHPFVLLLAPRYLLGLRHVERRPPQHALTICAIALVPLFWVGLLGSVFVLR